MRRATAADNDALPGTVLAFALGCPMPRTSDAYRVVFHTESGNKSLTWTTQGCGPGITVHRADEIIGPLLASTPTFRGPSAWRDDLHTAG